MYTYSFALHAYFRTVINFLCVCNPKNSDALQQCEKKVELKKLDHVCERDGNDRLQSVRRVFMMQKKRMLKDVRE